MKRWYLISILALVIIMALSLSGCGGGGGSDTKAVSVSATPASVYVYDVTTTTDTVTVTSNKALGIPDEVVAAADLPAGTEVLSISEAGTEVYTVPAPSDPVVVTEPAPPAEEPAPVEEPPVVTEPTVDPYAGMERRVGSLSLDPYDFYLDIPQAEALGTTEVFLVGKTWAYTETHTPDFCDATVDYDHKGFVTYDENSNGLILDAAYQTVEGWHSWPDRCTVEANDVSLYFNTHLLYKLSTKYTAVTFLKALADRELDLNYLDTVYDFYKSLKLIEVTEFSEAGITWVYHTQRGNYPEHVITFRLYDDNAVIQ